MKTAKCLIARLIDVAIESFRAISQERRHASRTLHQALRMDLKNLISRIELAASLGVATQTIAAWERRGLMPVPKLCLSDRLILYDRDEVRRAIEWRKGTRRRRTAPTRRGE